MCIRDRIGDADLGVKTRNHLDKTCGWPKMQTHRVDYGDFGAELFLCAVSGRWTVVGRWLMHIVVVEQDGALDADRLLTLAMSVQCRRTKSR